MRAAHIAPLTRRAPSRRPHRAAHATRTLATRTLAPPSRASGRLKHAQPIMPICPIRYLAWARRYYGQVAFDLATSGLPTVTPTELATLASDALRPEPHDSSLLAGFQQAVSSRYGTAPDEVFPCLGTSAGLWTACAALTSTGDEVLVETPTYEPLWAVPEGLGRKVRKVVRSSLSVSKHSITPESLGLTSSTRLVVLSNPHNPTGVFVDDDAIANLADALATKHVMLLVDEVYREFVAPRTTSFGKRPNVVIASSLTKRFGLGWIRAGWLLLDSSRVDAAWHALAHAIGSPPPWGFGVGARVLEHAAAVASFASRHQSEQRSLVERFAAKHAGVLDFTPPSGQVPFAFFLDRRGEDLLPRIERGVKEQSVLVAPGVFFGHPSGFRLSFTASSDVVAEGLRRLEQVLGL